MGRLGFLDANSLVVARLQSIEALSVGARMTVYASAPPMLFAVANLHLSLDQAPDRIYPFHPKRNFHELCRTRQLRHVRGV